MACCVVSPWQMTALAPRPQASSQKAACAEDAKTTNAKMSATADLERVPI
jgi:hypothetical protein